MKISKPKASSVHQAKRPASGALSTALEGRLAAYALAGAGAVLLSTSANAEVVYTPLDITVSRGTLQFDLNGDGVNDFALVNFERSYSSVYPVGALTVEGEQSGAGVLGETSPFIYGLPVPPGQPIGADSPKPFADAQARPIEMENASCYWLAMQPSPLSCPINGRWFNVKNKYIGLKFEFNGETHYGWVRATVALHIANNFKIPLITAHVTGYAYETVAGKTITAGDRGSAEATADRRSLGSLARGSARRK